MVIWLLNMLSTVMTITQMRKSTSISFFSRSLPYCERINGLCPQYQISLLTYTIIIQTIFLLRSFISSDCSTTNMDVYIYKNKFSNNQEDYRIARKLDVVLSLQTVLAVIPATDAILTVPTASVSISASCGPSR